MPSTGSRHKCTTRQTVLSAKVTIMGKADERESSLMKTNEIWEIIIFGITECLTCTQSTTESFSYNSFNPHSLVS